MSNNISVKDLSTELGISEFLIRKVARELFGRANGRWSFTKVQANKIRKLITEVAEKEGIKLPESEVNKDIPENVPVIETAAGPIHYQAD